MTLVRTGQGVTDIRGGTGGVYFTRDKSGLHQSAKPRSLRRETQAQAKQRGAFIKARAYCLAVVGGVYPIGWREKCVSYNIYRALNFLPMADPPTDYQIPKL
ncbi:hypothetical protein ES703_57509 [subsurface metagenome]